MYVYLTVFSIWLLQKNVLLHDLHYRCCDGWKMELGSMWSQIFCYQIILCIYIYNFKVIEAVILQLNWYNFDFLSYQVTVACIQHFIQRFQSYVWNLTFLFQVIKKTLFSAAPDYTVINCTYLLRKSNLSYTWKPVARQIYLVFRNILS